MAASGIHEQSSKHWFSSGLLLVLLVIGRGTSPAGTTLGHSNWPPPSYIRLGLGKSENTQI